MFIYLLIWNLPSNVTGLLHYAIPIIDDSCGLIIDYFAIFVTFPGDIILFERRTPVIINELFLVAANGGRWGGGGVGDGRKIRENWLDHFIY